MRLRVALRHPLGLALLVASVFMAVAAAALPALAPWSARATWLLVCGMVAYLATAVVVARSRSVPRARALGELWKIREAMLARRSELKASSSARANSELVRILGDAVGHLDRAILPELEQIVTRHEALSKQLERYDRWAVPRPDPLILERLRTIHARQREAIDACNRQAANAYATSLALTQEADETTVTKQVRQWADELGNLHDILAGLIRGGVDEA